MAELLLFRLYAPMAAFGDIAVGERRPSTRHPSHSALIGLICAALGLCRDDPLLPAMAEGYAFAVRVHQEGQLLADYHTAQTPPQRKGARWRTRREELAGERSTILSRRDYRTGSGFTAAALALDPAPEPLARLKQALRAPRFVLYAGRKSCPLGLPPDPTLVEAQSLVDAFASYEAARAETPSGKLLARNEGAEIHFAPVFAQRGLVGETISRCAERRDARPDRRLWRFDRREEWTIRMPGPQAAQKPPAEKKESRA